MRKIREVLGHPLAKDVIARCGCTVKACECGPDTCGCLGKRCVCGLPKRNADTVLNKNTKDRRNVWHDAHGHFTHAENTQSYGAVAAGHVNRARGAVERGASQEAADAIAQAAVAGKKIGKPLPKPLQFALLGLAGVMMKPSGQGQGKGYAVHQGGKHVGSVSRAGTGWSHSRGSGGFKTPTGAALHLLHTHNGYYAQGNNANRQRKPYPWKRRRRGLGQYYDQHVAAHLDPGAKN